jgi:hypothetical protein
MQTGYSGTLIGWKSGQTTFVPLWDRMEGAWLWALEIQSVMLVFSSVADPGCLSRIPDPDFYPSRIPDPGSRIPDPKTVTKERGEKNLLSYFFCSHKFHKIDYYVIFEMLKKIIWENFQRIVEVFTQKIFNMLSNKWVWDPGSGIRDPGSGKNLFRIPDPGSRGQKGTGSRIRNTGIFDRLCELLPLPSLWSALPPPPFPM